MPAAGSTGEALQQSSVISNHFSPSSRMCKAPNQKMQTGQGRQPRVVCQGAGLD